MQGKYFGKEKIVFSQMIGYFFTKYIMINQNSAENEMHIA